MNPTYRPVDFEHPLALKIRKQMVEALSEFEMIQDGDKVMVCCSGGKDSSILLALLSETQRRAPFRYELEAVMLDQGHPGFEPQAFADWVKSLGVKTVAGWQFCRIAGGFRSVERFKIPRRQRSNFVQLHGQ